MHVELCVTRELCVTPLSPVTKPKVDVLQPCEGSIWRGFLRQYCRYVPSTFGLTAGKLHGETAAEERATVLDNTIPAAPLQPPPPTTTTILHGIIHGRHP